MYNTDNNFSKSANSPLLNKKLTGKVKLVYNNKNYNLMDNYVKAALIASLDKFSAASGKDSAKLKADLIEVFSKDLGFLEKVGSLMLLLMSILLLMN